MLEECFATPRKDGEWGYWMKTRRSMCFSRMKKAFSTCYDGSGWRRAGLHFRPFQLLSWTNTTPSWREMEIGELMAAPGLDQAWNTPKDRMMDQPTLAITTLQDRLMISDANSGKAPAPRSRSSCMDLSCALRMFASTNPRTQIQPHIMCIRPHYSEPFSRRKDLLTTRLLSCLRYISPALGKILRPRYSHFPWLVSPAKSALLRFPPLAFYAPSPSP